MRKMFTLTCILILHAALINAQSWKLAGNNDATSASFLGTKNAFTLQFKVNNTKAGIVDFDSGRSNTSLGYQTLLFNSLGHHNSAFGYQSFIYNDSGSYNTSMGALSLFYNKTGNFNTSMGAGALFSNVVGYSNVAIGKDALHSSFDNSNIVAVGDSALFNNTSRRDFEEDGDYNTAIGSKTLFSNTTGDYNTALGFKALYSNVTGEENTAVGAYALKSNTGEFNTAVGIAALQFNTSGYANTAVGDGAINLLASGNQNTAVGSSAMGLTKKGNSNVAIGSSVLENADSCDKNTGVGTSVLANNKTGNSNTAAGYVALNGNTTGYSNVAIGTNALYKAKSVNNVVAIGDSALYNNGTGKGFSPAANANTAIGSKSLFANTTGYQNTATGYQSGNKNITGHDNTADGYRSLYNNTTGYNNTSMGGSALLSNTVGFNNVAVGFSSGSFNDNDTACTFLGYDADQSVTTNFYNSMALGNSARITASNYIAVGNTAIKSIKGQVNFTTFSDGRFKKEIKQNVPGLTFINKLKPVTYHLDVTGISQFLKEDNDDNTNSADGKSVKNLMQKAREEKEKILYTGFVAQDVEKAAKELNYDFSGVDKPENDNSLYGLRYAEFVVPLVKAVQELSNINDAKDAKINALQKQNDDLQQQFSELKTLVLSLQQCSPCNGSVTNLQTYNAAINDGSSLQQNIPNPFNYSTTIGYILPQKFTSAQIMITSQDGKVLKQVAVNGIGKGTLNVDASTLSSGAYSYSLIVDGKLIDTKKMILTK